MNRIKNWDELPMVLNAEEVSKILGISRPLVYVLFHKSGFSAIRASQKRCVIYRDALKKWMNTAWRDQSWAVKRLEKTE